MLSVLPEDSGVIRCICGFDHDDNFTIQCERCNGWQHAVCLDIPTEAAVPENYICPDCSESVTPMNREAARERQKGILKQRAQQAQAQSQRASQSPRSAPTPGLEDHDEPRRRGRKRRSESGPGEPIVVSNPEVYYVPSNKITWSRAAGQWQQSNLHQLKALPAVPRDAKAVPIQVVRRSTGSAQRINLGLNTLSLATPAAIPANRYICDVAGEALLRSEYAAEPHNQYARLGCPKPGTVFVPRLPLVIDGRRHGSQALFLRRGSQPNVRLVPCRTSKGELRVLLYSRTALAPGDELLLGWHWPAAHPIHTAPDSPALQTVFWLLEVPQSDCLPSPQEEDDEDWEIEGSDDPDSEVGVVERPVKHADVLRQEHIKRQRRHRNGKSVDAEPDGAPVVHVWVSPPQEAVVQKKKKLSLADYIKKRA